MGFLFDQGDIGLEMSFLDNRIRIQIIHALMCIHNSRSFVDAHHEIDLYTPARARITLPVLIMVS